MADTTDRWFLSDCEGRLEIWREAVLVGVTRDEHGEIDSYETPATWKTGDLIMGRDLDTWDEGLDEADDKRREIAAQIVRDHNEVERLTARIRDLYSRCMQGARDNGEYYERVPEAKYELGKATAWDGVAEMLRELVPDAAAALADRDGGDRG